MPFRSWIYAIALGIAFAASPEHGQGQEQNRGAEQNFGDEVGPLFWLGDYLNETPRIDRPCAQGEDDRYSDLCAQWKAADAAKESANWTRRAFWLGVLGVIVGGLTLGAAAAAALYAKAAADAGRRAADSADKMVGEAVRTTEAALETVSLTEKIGNRQIRPFVSYEKGNLEIVGAPGKPGRFINIDAVFRNCGASPGVITATSTSIYVPGGKNGKWKRVSANLRSVRIIIGPNQTDRISYQAISSDPDGSFSWFAIGILIWYEGMAISASTEVFEEHFWLHFNGNRLRQDYPSTGYDLYRPERNDD